jgi:hypothetical protein
VARNPQSQPPAGTSTGTELNADSSSGGKGRPTPTRREKEEARKRPLVANDRTERRRQERVARAAASERARIGMANGDEKYLPARDRGPQRRFVRDYVDARWGIGELMLPFIAVFFITSFAPPDSFILIIGFMAMWAVLIASILEAVFVGAIVKKKLVAKFGRADRGVRMYAALRGFYFRRMRLPKAQVQRGEFPT